MAARYSSAALKMKILPVPVDRSLERQSRRSSYLLRRSQYYCFNLARSLWPLWGINICVFAFLKYSEILSRYLMIKNKHVIAYRWRESISQVSLYLAKHLGKCSETLTFMSRCFTYVRRCAALAKYVYVRLDCAVSGTRSLKRKLFFNFFSFKFRKQLFKLQVWLNINPFFPNAPFLYPLKTCLHLRYVALGTNGLF